MPGCVASIERCGASPSKLCRRSAQPRMASAHTQEEHEPEEDADDEDDEAPSAVPIGVL